MVVLCKRKKAGGSRPISKSFDFLATGRRAPGCLCLLLRFSLEVSHDVACRVSERKKAGGFRPTDEILELLTSRRKAPGWMCNLLFFFCKVFRDVWAMRIV